MTTTTSTLSAPVQTSFSYKLLSVPTPYMIHNIPAMLKRMPKNGGKTLRMRRYNPLATATVPIGNKGVNVPPQQMTAVDIDAEISFYGTYIIINEQVTLQAQDPVLNECAARLGVSLRQTEDELTRNMLRSSASSINCTGGSSLDNPTEITRSDIDTIVRTLIDADATTISDTIEAEDRIGTSPVRDSFFALGSTKLIGDLEQIQGFISKAQYPNQSKTLRPEWGSCSNLRFLLSSIGSKQEGASNLGSDVYNIFCCAQESFCVVEQDGYSAQFIYRPPIYSGPLAMNVSIGYKMAQVPRIVNDAWIISLNTTLAA